MSIAARLKKRYAEAGRTGLSKEAASKDDIRRLKRDLDTNLRRQGAQQTTVQMTGRAMRMMGRGFGNIGRSLNNPSDTRRPKISQMPARRADIGISRKMDLSHLKHPALRKMDISGRKSK